MSLRSRDLALNFVIRMRRPGISEDAFRHGGRNLSSARAG